MSTVDSNLRKPLRLWPGVAIATVLVIVRYLIPAVAPEAEVFGAPLTMIGVLGGLACGLAIAIWWLFFSRARWGDRLGALALMVGAVLLARLFVHESIRGAHMGLMQFIYSIPVLAVALVVAVAATRHRPARQQRAAVMMAILLAAGGFTLIRTDGITGDGLSQLRWRWTPTAEERLLARASPEAPTQTPAPQTPVADAPASRETVAPRERPSEREPQAVATPAPNRRSPSEPAVSDAGGVRAPSDSPPVAVSETEVARPSGSRPVGWPGFRGPERNSVIRDVRINTDWAASPPLEIWRRSIGPAWSSFAVDGDLLYTQEQRGEHEIVSCYRVSTGEPVWQHRDNVRFYESNAGPGPRGTPTLSNGRVYAFGATGILNVLDATTGARVWSRDVQKDTEVRVPDWGFASSPLVVDDLVIVAASGVLAGYDTRTGDLRWLGPKGGSGYSSPHLIVIDGVPQVLLLRGSRTVSLSPADGRLLWEHVWQPGASIVQPAIVGEKDVIVSVQDAMGGLGLRRLSVTRGDDGWQVEERWTSRGLKPYFNDFVVHEGHAYGFDGNILAAISLEDGERRWKGGRYGNGQLVLLAEQDVLLVLSEDGELALVSATPDRYKEIARSPALDSKTWNHPVLVGDVLLVRNGEEMAAFRLHAVRASTRD